MTAAHLVIATPIYGSPESGTVTLGYHMAATKLCRAPDISFLEARLFVNCDLVRARSRALAMFMETGGSHLLFWDEDVVPRDLRIVTAMINSEKDVVAVPYPRKKVRYDELEGAVRNEAEQSELGRQTAEELEAATLDYSIQYVEPANISTDGIAEVTYVPMGFTMIRRECIEKMYAAHPELAFTDYVDGVTRAARALFMPVLEGERLYSEDYSFCHRWRSMGGKVHIIADPADHIGQHRFHGRWQGLVQKA
jgi:hypothetical protein